MNSSRQSATFRPVWWPVRINVGAHTARRLVLRLRRWQVSKSLAFRRIDVRERSNGDSVVLEAFAGGVRLAKLTAAPTRHLPREPWIDELPKDHMLPTYLVSECLVDARFRHHGIGRRLVVRLAKRALAQHRDALIAGRAHSPQARQFSASLGFNVRGEAAYATLVSLADRLLA
jgi:GNAT superfamily N-acetyltransferase